MVNMVKTCVKFYKNLLFLLLRIVYYLHISECILRDACRTHASSVILWSWKILFCSLQSSLWLQYKPHHIAAGAAYLASKFLKIDLTAYHNIWQEFGATPSILRGTLQTTSPFPLSLPFLLNSVEFILFLSLKWFISNG